MNLKKTLALTLTVALFSASVAFANAFAATLLEADTAYRHNRIAEAEILYSQIAQDREVSAADRAQAMRELGRIAWLVHGDPGPARAAVAQAPKDELCATLASNLRALRESGDLQTGIDATARKGACTAAEFEKVQVELALSHMAFAQSNGKIRKKQLAAAKKELALLDPIVRRQPAAASAALSLALMQRDGDAAFKAWREFYWLDHGDAPPALSAYDGRVRDVFVAGLAKNAAEKDVIALVDMLITAGFASDAERLAVMMSDHPDWKRARLYFRWHNGLREALLRNNRALAGRADPKEQYTLFESEFKSLTSAALKDAGIEGDDPIAGLMQLFGVFGTTPGMTGNYPGVHMGHFVLDDKMKIEQYGRRGQVRFVVIDNMIGNGYEGWLWDGRAMTGGWSSAGNMIVQVRSAYSTGPIQDLRRSKPGADREAYIARIEQRTPEERAALERNPVSELAATSMRLNLQALDEIYEKTGGDETAFLAEILRATNQTSIEAHEGRHALDNLEEPDLTTPELEFRGKLSQIIFADYPRLGLASLASGLHDDSPHGIGNIRALGGYVDWMRKNSAEIEGFDADTPVLMQLPLLTDAQIVAAARAQDPWAQ